MNVQELKYEIQFLIELKGTNKIGGRDRKIYHLINIFMLIDKYQKVIKIF